MNHRKEFRIEVVVPTSDEFAEKYRQYGPFARAGGAYLYELLASPEQQVKAQIVTVDLDLPAVAGVAKDCAAAAKRKGMAKLNAFTKQFIGAVVCNCMEANGFEKTGVKRSIPHQAFSRGEVYRRKKAAA